MSLAFNVFKKGLLDGSFDLAATDGIWVRLVSCLTTSGSATGTGEGNVDPDDAVMTNYAKYTGTTDQEITSTTTVTQDDTDDEGVWDDTATVTFSTVAISGGEDIDGMVIYKYVDGTDGNDIPLLWINDGGFNITPNGSDITITWNSEGILNVIDA